MLEHREIAPGVHLARTVYGRDGGETKVQLMNLSKHPAEIQGNEIVGELTPVNVISNDSGQEQQLKTWPEKIEEMTEDLPPKVTPKEKRQLMEKPRITNRKY